MSGSPSSAPPTDDSRGLGSTVWSLVLAAGRTEDGGAALERLCQKHWRPIYVFVRRSGLSGADAEDVTQEFFLYLLEKQWLKKADPARGSFRAFLLALLRNYLANDRRMRGAEKRRVTASCLPLSAAEGERACAAIAADGDPARAFESAWARGILQTAWARLSDEQARAGKVVQFDALRPFVTQSPEAGDYERLGQTLGIRRGQVALLVHRLSSRYAELVRAEVAETLADPSDLEAELRHLIAVSAS